jgi:hypothetical protein
MLLPVRPQSVRRKRLLGSQRLTSMSSVVELQYVVLDLNYYDFARRSSHVPAYFTNCHDNVVVCCLLFLGGMDV